MSKVVTLKEPTPKVSAHFYKFNIAFRVSDKEDTMIVRTFSSFSILTTNKIAIKISAKRS